MADETFDPDAPVTAVDGVGPARSEDLNAAGYDTVADLRDASVSDLAAIVRGNVARSIVEQVGGDSPGGGPPSHAAVTSIAEAKEKAQQIPGAKAKTVRRADGTVEVRVLETVADKSTAGGHMTVRKG